MGPAEEVLTYIYSLRQNICNEYCVFGELNQVMLAVQIEGNGDKLRGEKRNFWIVRLRLTNICNSLQPPYISYWRHNTAPNANHTTYIASNF